jgi:large repetitive protein
MRASKRRARLAVQSLEGREVPANVVAEISNGTLFIIGSSADDSIILSQPSGAGTLTITPVGESLNGRFSSDTGPLPRSVDILLGSGDDTVAFDLSAQSIVFPGTLAINYGTAGIGTKVTQTTGATSNTLTVGGSFGIHYAAGTVTTNLDNLSLAAGLGVTHGSGDSTFRVDNKVGDGTFSVIHGALTVTNAAGVANNTLEDTNVGGTVTFSNGKERATDDAAGFTKILNSTNSNFATIGGGLVITNASGNSTTGDIVGDVLVKGGVSIGLGTGTFKATVAAQHVSSAPVIKGNLTVTSLTTGIPTVNLGAAGTGLDVGGAMSVRAGNGGATITLTDVQVTGATGITTGAGNDTVSVDTASGALGSLFHGFSANTGAGNDKLTIGGGSGTTTFRGTTNVNLSTGDDTLALAATGPVDFFNVVPMFNGGTGTNTHTGNTANLSGKTPVFKNFV